MSLHKNNSPGSLDKDTPFTGSCYRCQPPITNNDALPLIVIMRLYMMRLTISISPYVYVYNMFSYLCKHLFTITNVYQPIQEDDFNLNTALVAFYDISSSCVDSSN